MTVTLTPRAQILSELSFVPVTADSAETENLAMISMSARKEPPNAELTRPAKIPLALTIAHVTPDSKMLTDLAKVKSYFHLRNIRWQHAKN